MQEQSRCTEILGFKNSVELLLIDVFESLKRFLDTGLVRDFLRRFFDHAFEVGPRPFFPKNYDWVFKVNLQFLGSSFIIAVSPGLIWLLAT